MGGLEAFSEKAKPKKSKSPLRILYLEQAIPGEEVKIHTQKMFITKLIVIFKDEKI